MRSGKNGIEAVIDEPHSGNLVKQMAVDIASVSDGRPSFQEQFLG
jgi:hypothetical protein